MVDIAAAFGLVTVLLLSLTVLVGGWMLANPALTYVSPGLAAMVPSTAALFAVATAAMLARARLARTNRRLVMRAAAALLILVASGNVLTMALTPHSGIDQLLLPQMDVFRSDRMSLGTSLCFFLLAISFAAMDSAARKQPVFTIAGSCGLALSALAIIVYAFDAQSLYKVALFTTMALHTACCFAVLFLATLWARRDRGWMAIIDSNGNGSISARRLLPYCIILPLGLALIINQSLNAELFDPKFGLSLLAIATIAVLFTIILRDAAHSNLIEAEHLQNVVELAQLQASKDAMAESEANFRQLAEAMPVGIFRTDKDGNITFANAAMGNVLRRPAEGLRGQELSGVLDYDPEGRGVLSLDGSLHEADLCLRAAGENIYTRAVSSPILGGITGAKGHVGALVDMTENRRAMEALREARDDAQAAARAKSSFLANMSHEIRTPMNGVLGFAQLLIDADLDEEHDKYAHLILESGQSMVAILNDILDLSKIEAGQMEIREEAFDLHHAVSSTIKLMRGAAIAKTIGLEIAIADDVPRFARGDALRLRQVLSNLVGNAIKFTEEGHVRIAVTTLGGMVAVSVSDTGIGISVERQAHIFEEFVQSDGSIARRFGGTGLGLAISRKLAELMGGSLTLSSVEGQGTDVLLSLPLREADVPPDGEKKTLPMRSDDTGSAPRSRILVAEDNDINQVLIKNLLGTMGHKVDMVEDGADAIAAVQKAEQAGEPYPLVLMDVQMPRVDGLEATGRLRENGHDAEELPIIAVTANAYESDIQECLDAGMQDHLVKPIRKDELAAVIGKWLG